MRRPIVGLMMRVTFETSDVCAFSGGRTKVYIVDEAHANREAWNALLKILEEPPPRVISFLPLQSHRKFNKPRHRFFRAASALISDVSGSQISWRVCPSCLKKRGQVPLKKHSV